jgi:HK97 family phage portal protein
MYNPFAGLFHPKLEAAVPGPLDDYWYMPVGMTTPAGVDVTIDSAARVSAVYACVRVLRETLGYLPFCVYERTDPESEEKATGNYLWKVLHDKPNRWQTPFSFKELGVNHLLLRGNFYCEIVGSHDNMELWPLNPERMEVKQTDNGDVRYYYHRQSGEPVEYAQEDIYHVMGQTLNGISGVSVIEYARNTIGATIAQETHGASLFKNGGMPPFWIWRPPEKKWTDTAIKNFRRGWRKLHGGAENAGSPPILSDGMELRELSISNRDSQWIESRGLSAEEICRFFGVSPHMIGVKSTAPKGNTEQQALEFSMYTLAPMAARFEQAADRDLVQDPDKHFTRFNLDATCRADTKTRHEAHNIAVQGGWKTINEVRSLENLNPKEGGDVLRTPLNMQPAGGGPDENEQGGQPGKGTPKPPKQQPSDDAEPTANERQNEKRREAQASFAILLDEAAERIAAAEIKALSVRADKAAGDYGRWCEWVFELYHSSGGSLGVYIKKTLAPICNSWDIVGTSFVDRDYVAAVVGDSHDAIIGEGEDVPAAIEQWKTTRAGELATILKEEFFDENL